MRNCESIIFIIEKGTHDVLSIPWTPQKIKFRSGGQNFAEYDIMDLGTIQEPTGTGVRSIRWDDGILPGRMQANMPWQMVLGNRLSIFKVCFQCGKLIKRYLRF